MNYKFQNLLGGSYKGGNLVLRGKELLSATGNRVVVVGPDIDILFNKSRSYQMSVVPGPEFIFLQTNLQDSNSKTLQFESNKQASTIETNSLLCLQSH